MSAQKKYVPLLLAVIWLVGTTISAAFGGFNSMSDTQLMIYTDGLLENCRGGLPNLKSTKQACVDYGTMKRLLDKRGWCWGKKTDEYAYQHSWHKCNANSYHWNSHQ